MYGSGAYKPLHMPKPRRRDRRGGKRSAHRDAVLRRPTGGGDGGRPPHEKRRALGRLLERYLGKRSGQWLARLGVAAVTATVLVGAFATTRVGGLVPYAEAPAEYAQLAEALATSCAEGVCGFAAGSSPRPPAEARRLMPRLGVRYAAHDSSLGRSTFRNGYGRSSAALVYHHPGPLPMDSTSVRNRAWLAERDSLDAARAYGPRRTVEDLGDGWQRVSRR